MQKYSDFKEVRFKIPDNSMQLYEDMALYFYEKKVIDKLTIHAFGRWCMKQITDANALQMFQWNIARNRLEQHQQQQQQQMLQQQQQAPYNK
jgi:translation initiation factor IF-3